MASRFPFKILALLAGVMAVAGCAEIDRQHISQVQQRIEAGQAQFPAVERPKTVEYSDKPYIGNRFVPVSPEKRLPPVFSQPTRFGFTSIYPGGRVNLSTVADRVQKMTGIPVTISSDVYIRSATVGGKTNTGGQGNTTGQASGSAANLAYDFDPTISLDFEGSLANFLDGVVAKVGISWEYKDGRINFFRFATKTYEVKALFGTASINSNFSSSGTISSGSNSGGKSDGGSSEQQVGIQETRNAKLDLWKSLKEEVEAFLNPGERLAVNETAGTITVQAAPSTLKRVGEFLEDQNRRISRLVYVKVEIYSYETSDDQGLGLDLASVYTSSSGKYRLLSSSGSNLFSGTGSSIGTFVLGPTTSPSMSSPGTKGDAFTGFQGSKVVLDVLSQRGRVAFQDSTEAMTINGHPVPVTMSLSRGYLQSFTQTTNGSATTNSVQQSTVTAGVFLDLTPRVLDDNSVLLQYTVDLSDLQSLDSQTTGGVTLQTPTVTRKATQQVTKLKLGETMVIAGMGRRRSQDGAQAGMSMGFRNQQTSEHLLIFLTPVLAG